MKKVIICCAVIWGTVSAGFTADSNLPVILEQPTNQIVFLGWPAVFYLKASSPSPITYQWFFNNEFVRDQLLRGATNSTLHKSAATQTDTGWYYAVVSNDSGYVTSGIARLLLKIPVMPPDGATLYQILSGTYGEVGGIGGFLQYQLPVSNQRYLAIWTNPANATLEMRFLDQYKTCSMYILTNGLPTPTNVFFDCHSPVFYRTNYLATNNYELKFAGAIVTLNGFQRATNVYICCDVPIFLMHSNVVAEALTVLTMQKSSEGVDLSWQTIPNQTYQIQRQTDLKTNWMELGPAIIANGEIKTITISNTEPSAFYRVIRVP